MTPEQKGLPIAVLLRAYVLGWSTPEIAGAFNLSLSTVNQRLAEAGVIFRRRGGKRHFGLGALGKRWVE